MIKLPLLAVFLPTFLFAATPSSPAQTTATSALQVDYEKLVSHADLNYDTPTNHSVEGTPIGNGRTGSLVWTTPAALHFQVNRVDLFCMGKNSRSFPVGNNAYSSGCGFVDINVEAYGDDIFTGPAFRQHLSVYDGLTTVAGQAVISRALAWNNGDVIAVEIDDQREHPEAVNIDLRMLRLAIDYVAQKSYDLLGRHAIQVQNGAHTAESRLEIRAGRILLIQEFREGDFYSASAVAMGVTGRESKTSYQNESTVRLSVAPGRGKFTTLMASAVSYDPKVDVGDLALQQLTSAAGLTFDDLLADNRTWWSQYWPKSLVHLHSADGVADEIETNYTYFLYIMGSCSRGTYMPRYCGMLWGSNGDLREWGSEYWWHNQSTYYNGLEPANRPELLAPVFATYTRNLDSFTLAARQQWGSRGIWIPETFWFNGLEDLPEPVANEMRALYLGQKPWKDRSVEFMNYAKGKSGMDSRWNWNILPDARAPQPHGDLGPYSWTSHVLSTTAKVAYAYWLHFAYSLDEDWLRTQAYPIIKGAAELYRNFPNLYRADDGRLHIRRVNNLENHWGGTDSPEELTAMHEIFPLAIRASEILGVDSDLRPLWKKTLDQLTPIPPGLEPAQYYDLCCFGTADQPLHEAVLAEFNRHVAKGMSELTTGSQLSRTPIAACNLGLTDKVKAMQTALVRSRREPADWDYAGRGEWSIGVMRNRLALEEGPGAIEGERLGMAAQTLHLSLLQSVPPTPGGDPVNYLFPTWPRDWDAQFTLAARDAFLISSSLKGGQIEFVEVQSRKGGRCRVQNPWGEAALTLQRAGKAAQEVSGQLLVIDTAPGETLTLVPQGQPIPHRVVPE